MVAPTSRIWAFGLVLLGLLSGTFGKSYLQNEEDLDRLLKDVQDVKIGGSPAFLSVFGPDAFPVLAGQHGGSGVYHPIAAGGRLGTAKILGSTHDGFLDPENPPTSGKNTFILNGIRWAAKSEAPALNVALIRNNPDALVDFLAANSLPTTRIPLRDLQSADQLREFDVVLVKEFFDKDKSPIFTSYAESGGGLVVSLTSWAHYYFLNVTGHFGENFGANVVSSPSGFVWRGDETTASATTPQDTFNASRTFLSNTNVLDAWKEIKNVINAGFEQDPGTSLVQYSSILEYGFEVIPRNDDFWKGDFYTDAKNYTQVDGQPIPSQRQPVTEDKDKFLLQIYHGLSAFVLQTGDMTVHPGSKVFPGEVSLIAPDAPTHQISLKHKKPSWFREFSTDSSRNVWDYVPRSNNVCHEDDPLQAFGDNHPEEDEEFVMSNRLPLWFSTGLYAGAGEVIEVTLNSDENLDSYRVQIGTHTDDISRHPGWFRSPRLVLRKNFEHNSATISSPYGGLIYIMVPESEISVEEKTISVTVRGSVRAPLFRLGETKKHEWKDTIRNYPGPWAELETKNIVLSVPSASIRDMEDPEDLLLYWDQVMDAIADLISMPRERYRQERMVPDIQISAGFMHSGYPIMTFLNEGNMAVNVSLLRTEGSWGHYHELGHNHQHGDWTFSGTGEVTCNLFALYVYNTVCGIPTSQTRSDMSPEKYKVYISDYITGGLKFEQWKGHPWIALMFYVQLQREFGWSSFKQVFANYRLLGDNDRPKNDQEKIDLWLIMFSHVVQKNLAPFFESWGFPISEEASNAVAGYPDTPIRIFDLLRD